MNIDHLEPLSAHQRNAIQMAFRWRADSGLTLRAYEDIQCLLVNVLSLMIHCFVLYSRNFIYNYS